MASNGESSFRLLAVAPRTRELTGAADLISHYHLREQYEAVCKKPLPNALSDSSYMSNAVGDRELRSGEGMELGQLIQGSADSSLSIDPVLFQPFDLELLRKAFTLKEAGPISLPESEKGLPTVGGKDKDQDEEAKKKKKHKHRSSKDRVKDKDKEKEKKKDRDKDKKKEKDRDRSNGERKQKKKKRRHEGEDGDDGHRHKSKKHKNSSKVERQTVLIKNGK